MQAVSHCLCVCVCVGCVFLSFPFGFVACFDTLFDVTDYVHLLVCRCVCTRCSNASVPVEVVHGRICVCDRSLRSCGSSLPVWHTLAKSCQPLIKLLSLHLSNQVENRLGWINLHSFFFLPFHAGDLNSCRGGSDTEICCELVAVTHAEFKIFHLFFSCVFA